MEEQERPFTFLMPADEAIYTPFDFRLMGNDDEEGLADADGETLARTMSFLRKRTQIMKGVMFSGLSGRARP